MHVADPKANPPSAELDPKLVQAKLAIASDVDADADDRENEPSANAAADDGGDGDAGEGENLTAAQKKRRRKKKAAGASASNAPTASKKEEPLPPGTKQTEPPSIPVRRFFLDGHYPEGELQDYRDEYAAICMRL